MSSEDLRSLLLTLNVYSVYEVSYYELPQATQPLLYHTTSSKSTTGSPKKQSNVWSVFMREHGHNFEALTQNGKVANFIGAMANAHVCSCSMAYYCFPYSIQSKWEAGIALQHEKEKQSVRSLVPFFSSYLRLFWSLFCCARDALWRWHFLLLPRNFLTRRESISSANASLLTLPQKEWKEKANCFLARHTILPTGNGLEFGVPSAIRRVQKVLCLNYPSFPTSSTFEKSPVGHQWAGFSFDDGRRRRQQTFC